ncbi:secretory phospholipase A2 receptor-like [Lates japonicus]
MMERILLAVFSLSGWLTFSTCRPHQYHYVSDSKNWTEAQTYCRETYTDLATIENTEEMNQLINTVSSAGYNSDVWVGLYSKVEWKWSDGYTGSGAEFRSWQTKKLYINSETRACVMSYSTGEWWGGKCTWVEHFICYKGTQLEPEYVFVNQAMVWSSAQRYCRENFVDLVTVRNKTENFEIQNLASGWAWIGLFGYPRVHWSDGSVSSFRSWYSSGHAIHVTVTCGAAALQNSGKWRLLPCGTRLPFVCSSIPPPLKRQVVKLRMKVENSSVDLNDPAVKAGILKKLQDRLEENGVSGVSLKWSEQPDGKVFHKEGEKSSKEEQKKTELTQKPHNGEDLAVCLVFLRLEHLHQPSSVPLCV